VLLRADRLGVGARVRELGLLGRDEEQRLVAEVERDRTVLGELAVDRRRLVEALADPRGRLAEEVAAVAAGRLAGQVAALDEDDPAARLGERAGGRAAGETAPEDDDVGGLGDQLSDGSPAPAPLSATDGSAGAGASAAPLEPLRLRQNMTAPAVAPAAAATVPTAATVFFLLLPAGLATDFTPCLSACFASGLAPV
jgi:hypothetical protein